MILHLPFPLSYCLFSYCDLRIHFRGPQSIVHYSFSTKLLTLNKNRSSKGKIVLLFSLVYSGWIPKASRMLSKHSTTELFLLALQVAVVTLSINWTYLVGRSEWLHWSIFFPEMKKTSKANLDTHSLSRCLFQFSPVYFHVFNFLL